MSIIIYEMKKARITAMKSKDQVRKSTLTTVIGDAETIHKGPFGPMTDDKMIALVKKHITGLEEMVSHGKDVERCEQEIGILSEYLPSQMDEGQITSILSKAFKTGQVNDMGSAMKFMKTHYAGQYDGKVASSVAKSLL